MFINPVNSAELYSYVRSSGFYNTPRITDRYDLKSHTVPVEEISKRIQHTPNAPVSKSNESFKNFFEKAKKALELESSGTVNNKRENKQDDKSKTKSADSQASGFVVTVPEEHLRNLDYKTDIQQQVFELFNPIPDRYVGALVDVSA